MKKTVYLFLIFTFLISCNKIPGIKSFSTDDKTLWNTQGKVDLGEDEITLTGRDAKAITTASFENFVLEFECKTTHNAIGRVCFHSTGLGKCNSGYELLINNNSEPTEWRKTGSLTSIRNFGKCVAYNEEWTPIKLEVRANNIRVYVNGLWVVDYYEPESPYRTEENRKKVLSEGVFVFANIEDAPISYRNIKVEVLADDLKANTPEVWKENSDPLFHLHQINFPLIDTHLHLKGELKSEDVEALTRIYGITYAIAPNCGLNFPITADNDIYNWLDTTRNHLYLLPMQAEGREWTEMFSREAIEQFDYVFTDALTWTDNKGRRNRIWIPEETFIDDKQEFMEILVDRAVEIINTETFDIFVNPTFLPQALQPEYDSLWTSSRMERVIDACIANDVAIEINNRYKIPSENFIKLAKEKGGKFSIGTNNEGIHDVSRLEYAIKIINDCGLTADDMYIPYSKNR